jgi:hypothetical protein
MRGLLVCALVLALGLANGDSGCVCNYGHHHRPSRGCSSLQAKVDAQTARIGRLSGHVHALQEKLNDGAEKREKIRIQQAGIDNRLSHLEPHHCKKNEFYCGDEDNVCVSKLLVCDKKPDCGSESDEASNRCDNPAHSGSVFIANIHNDRSLCTTRRLNSIKIFVTSERRLTWFPSRILVDGTIELNHSSEEAEQVDTLAVHGYYDAAHLRLVFHPPEDDRLGVICEFDGVDNDHCHGFVVREATLTRCLEFFASRE